jgi:hypothetical protein
MRVVAIVAGALAGEMIAEFMGFAALIPFVVGIGIGATNVIAADRDTRWRQTGG